VATAASPPPGRGLTSFEDLRVCLREEEEPFLILFGTGHGLATQVLDEADRVLPPVRGAASFNHLSVRAAAAIVLDRLLGDWAPTQD